MENDKFERRSYTFDIRAEQTDEYGVIEGRAIVYNSVSDMGYFDEVIASGALDGTNLRDVRFLVNHDLSRIPLARSRNNNANSTMQLMKDEFGLSVRVKLDTERNTEARALYSAVERGDITGMSFMFSIDSEEWSNLESDHPTRTITGISRVIEVSAVTFPAYEDTEINVRNKSALDNARLALESARNKRSSPDGERAQKEQLELLKEKTKLLGGF